MSEYVAGARGLRTETFCRKVLSNLAFDNNLGHHIRSSVSNPSQQTSVVRLRTTGGTINWSGPPRKTCEDYLIAAPTSFWTESKPQSSLPFSGSKTKNNDDKNRRIEQYTFPGGRRSGRCCNTRDDKPLTNQCSMAFAAAGTC
jgi:hypothetical protein